METIKRDEDVILKNEDLIHLYTFKDFPVFMGCTDEPIENDVKSDMSWYISNKSGMVQLNPVLPLDIVYMSDHGSGTVGNSWGKHHQSFAKFVNKFGVNSVLEIGGSHGILSENCYQLNNKIDWVIVEPNPIVNENLKAKVIKGFFDDKFKTEDKYDAVVHSHVFEHVYQPNDFIKHISSFLDDGLMIFSVPNMDKMINKCYNNCINFEHTILLGEDHIDYILKSNGFEIVDREFYKDDHSIFYCAKKINHPIDNPLGVLSKSKNKYENLFDNYIKTHLGDIHKINNIIDNTNNNVYLFGAHIFSQYLISFGLNTDKIKYILDNDKNKHNKRLYGTNLITKSTEVIKNDDDAIVILRTAFYDEEIKKDILNNINNKITFI